MATYYGQRASAGLIISEATDVDQSSHGSARTPGIHSRAQMDGWRLVTDAVHRRGGTIFMQLWHVGRLAHSSILPNGQAPVGVTDQRAEGSSVVAHGPDGVLGYMPAETPRALSTDEVSAMVDTFAKAAASWTLVEAERSTYYTRRGVVGYTDFPPSQVATADARHAA